MEESIFFYFLYAKRSSSAKSRMHLSSKACFVCIVNPIGMPFFKRPQYNWGNMFKEAMRGLDLSHRTY